MGLFGGIKKALGFAARVGLSKLTGGASDIVLKKLKGTGQVKQVLAKKGMPTTAQDRALVNKLFPDAVNPSIKQTEQVLDAAGSRAGVPGYPKRVGKNGKTGKRKYLTDLMGRRIPPMPPEYKAQGGDLEMYRENMTPEYRGYDESGKMYPLAARLKNGKKKKLKGTGRSTPQAQKMKALAATWRGLGGQAGTGQSFFAWKAGR